MLKLFLSVFQTSVNALSGPITEAYKAKLSAQTAEEVLAANHELAWLQAQQSIMIAESGRWYTAWVRPMLCLPAVAFWWKVVIWDTLLGWGVTEYPGEPIMWFVTLVPLTYIAVRPFEKMKGK